MVKPVSLFYSYSVTNKQTKMTTTKTFRIWHQTSFGIGFEDKRAKSLDTLKLSKWLKDRLIEIEQLA